MLTFYIGSALLGSFSSFLMSSIAMMAVMNLSSGISITPIMGVLFGITGVVVLIAINLGNNWKSWGIGILAALAVNMATAVVFLAACFIAIGANSDALLTSVMALLLVVPIILMIIAAWIYAKIISKDNKSNQNPQMRLWAE